MTIYVNGFDGERVDVESASTEDLEQLKADWELEIQENLARMHPCEKTNAQRTLDTIEDELASRRLEEDHHEMLHDDIRQNGF